MAKKAAEHDDLGFVADAPGAEADDDLGFTADTEVGFEPEETGHMVLRKGLEAIGAVGKGADYLRGLTGGPAVDMALEAATGKDVYHPEEAAAARDVTTLKTYPMGSEALKRAGVPEGARFSDYASGPLSPLPIIGDVAKFAPFTQFADPSPNNPWYQAEKGGLLDFSARDAGGFALDAARDPLTYLTFGGSAVAKPALRAGQSPVAKTFAKKLLETLATPATLARGVAKFPSDTLARAGKKLYASGLQPIIEVGEKKGKDIAETFYKYGLHGSSDNIDAISKKVQRELKGKVDAILNRVDAAGGRMDLGKAFEPYLKYVDELVRDSRLSPEHASKILEDTIGEYLKRKKPTSTALGTKWKTDISSSLPDKVHNVTGDRTLGQKLKMVAAGGLRDEVENEAGRVGKNLGQGGFGKEIHELNSDLGDLLTVRDATARAAAREARHRTLTPADMATFALGTLAPNPGSFSPAYGTSALIAKRLLELTSTTRARTTPGYLLRKAAENPLLSPAFDTWSRKKLIELADKQKEKAAE